MYLRTTTRHNRDGSSVQYYQLAHNQRDPVTGVVSAKVIHSFGRRDELDRDSLVRLCRSIARVCEIEVNDPLVDDTVGDHSGDPMASLNDPLEAIQTRSFGTALVIEELWERFGLGAVLRGAARQEGCKVPYERALLAMTANRLCDPESKLGVWDRWLRDEIHLPSCGALKLAQMYEAMDLLQRHSGQVEEHVFFKTADLLNLDVDLVFYDTTTCSFAIDQADAGDDGLRRFGHSKEGTWTPQVVVALAVTREGLPVRSWVFKGNCADVTTVEQIKKDLRGWKLGRALFVSDSGMNSEENRQELARACGRYLMAMRVGSVAEVKREVLSRPGRFKVIEENLHAKEVLVGDGERRRRYILCFNPDEATRQKSHRAQVLEELEQELASHPQRSAQAKWAIELQASRRYGRYLAVNSKGELSVDRSKVKELERLDGKWVLLTNDDTLSVEDAATGYKGLLVIERCFRTLKRTQIQLTPMYHWLARRIEAHVKICVLALLLERVAELKTGKTWATIRRTLDRLQVTEYETPTHRFFRTNRPSPDTLAILKTLGIPTPKSVLAIEERA